MRLAPSDIGSTDANPHPVLKLIPAHPDAPSATRTARAGAAKRRSVIRVLLFAAVSGGGSGKIRPCKHSASGAGSPLGLEGERPMDTGLDTPPGRILLPEPHRPVKYVAARLAHPTLIGRW